MSDDLLERYRTTGEHAAKVVSLHEDEEPANLGCFGYLRGVRDKAISLELCKLDGHVLAVVYAYITRFEYEPEKGITLWLPDRSIRIQGTRLNTKLGSVRLFEALTRHRVPWLKEVSRSEALGASEDQVVIESIEWDVK